MKKLITLSLLISVIFGSGCGLFEGCNDIGCDKFVQLNLNNAVGDISGKIIVDGRDHIIEVDTAEDRCSAYGSVACLRENGVIELRIGRPGEEMTRITEYDVAVDITAQEGDVIRRAAGSVMLQETSYQVYEDACDEGCAVSSATGTVTLQ